MVELMLTNTSKVVQCQIKFFNAGLANAGFTLLFFWNLLNQWSGYFFLCTPTTRWRINVTAITLLAKRAIARVYIFGHCIYLLHIAKKKQ
jgi:hypothetical protein